MIWDFGYAPVSPAAAARSVAARVLVVATPAGVAPSRLAAVLGSGAQAETVLARAPVFWTRLTLAEPLPAAGVAARLRAAGVALRYVASAEQPSLALGAPFDVRAASPVTMARAEAWPVRAARRHPPPDAPGAWFLRDGEGGVAVDRARGGTGTGAGTRLAVIDDDGLFAEALELDAEVLVDLDEAPRHSVHGALMVAWAAGARGFAGVAPDTAPRLYLIPKPGSGVLALPLAIARAALDGADVIVCATYVEGSTSPMLDDALELSARLGRRGRGAAVVLPVGREASSPPGSLHASFSLGFGEPASDPRVFCVAPGARGEGWFFWHDRRGRLRPFGNRGPAVRWLAPGDDIAYPFAGTPRLFHAESSGASAVAAGVLLLVLSRNPELRLAELAAVISASLVPVPPAPPPTTAPLADPADTLPHAQDRDGHNAKHGYGRIDAGRACLAGADPITAALVAMGEDGAARTYADLRRTGAIGRVYSRRVGRWMVRALLADGEAAHAVRAVLRHLRLVSRGGGRLEAHGAGALTRQIQLVLRRLAGARPPAARRAELEAIAGRLAAVAGDPAAAASFEAGVASVASRIFAGVTRPLIPHAEPA